MYNSADLEYSRNQLVGSVWEDKHSFAARMQYIRYPSLNMLHHPTGHGHPLVLSGQLCILHHGISNLHR